MSKAGAVFSLLVCCAVIVQAQVSGTVTGNGSGIAGARISFKNNPHRIAYTDASGAFSLNVPVIKRQRAGTSSLPSIKNNCLLFTAERNIDNARIDLFSLNGTLLFSREAKNLAPGSHRFPLAKTAQGAYIVRFSAGTDRFVMRMAGGNGTVTEGRQGTASPGPSLKKAFAADFIDTVIVCAPGWKHKLIGIADYNDQVTAELSASNPWKPSGSFVKDKGMVKVIASGHDFEMGQPDPNLGGEQVTRYDLPVHTVSFTYDFWMDTVEVTQKRYDSVMGAVYDDYVPVVWDEWYGLGDRYPAYLLLWGNAVLFCNARSKLEGLDTLYRYDSLNAPTGEYVELFGVSSDFSKNGYRLPTEAEWEYACKGGTATDFYWGKNYGPYPASPADSAEIGQNAVWRATSWDMGEGETGYGNHQVASTKPNAYGLYDMAGNASEHCHDYWTDNLDYGTVVDPTGPEEGILGRIIRGGNWGNDAEALRSANRFFSAPNYEFFFVGFRTVRPVR